MACMCCHSVHLFPYIKAASESETLKLRLDDLFLYVDCDLQKTFANSENNPDRNGLKIPNGPECVTGCHIE